MTYQELNGLSNQELANICNHPQQYDANIVANARRILQLRANPGNQAPSFSFQISGQNVMQIVLICIAAIIFIAEFALGIINGWDYKGNYMFRYTLNYWLNGLFYATVIIGISEIIRLFKKLITK